MVSSRGSGMGQEIGDGVGVISGGHRVVGGLLHREVFTWKDHDALRVFFYKFFPFTSS